MKLLSFTVKIIISLILTTTMPDCGIWALLFKTSSSRASLYSSSWLVWCFSRNISYSRNIS